MEKFANDNLILIEFLVDNICFEYSVQQSLKCMQGETCVGFQFLDNTPLYICEEDFAPKSQNYADGCTGCSSMKNGKSCLFALSPKQARDCMSQFDIYVEVFRKLPKGMTPEKLSLGESLISIVNLFQEMVSGFNSSANDTPVAKTLKDCFKVQNISGELVGRIGVYIRLSTFGKLIVTQFQMNLQDKSVEFKAKEGHYLFQTKANNMGPSKKKKLADEKLSVKNVFDLPCGLPLENQRRPCAGEMMSCPRPPPGTPYSETVSCSPPPQPICPFPQQPPCAIPPQPPCAKPPPCSVPPCAQPYPPPCAVPPCIQPLPCPVPPCAQPHPPPCAVPPCAQPPPPPPCAVPPCVKPPPCMVPPCAQPQPCPPPPPCPRPPPPCPAMNLQNAQQETPCPLCGQCILQLPNAQKQTCQTYLQQQRMQQQSQMPQQSQYPQFQNPQQMMPFSPSNFSTPCMECSGNYASPPVPPPPDGDYQEFGAEMGGNSLIIRVHKDKTKVEQVKNDDACCCEPGGKPKAAVYQASSPSPCYCVQQGGEATPRSPAANGEVCPSCCPDNNAPFSFKMGGTTQADNNICVISPNNTAKGAGPPGPLADPTKDVFILRIGKKNESATKKNNMEIELCTPRGKTYKPPIAKIEAEQQCEPQMPDADGRKSKKSDKGGKGGKGGKGKGKKK